MPPHAQAASLILKEQWQRQQQQQQAVVVFPLICKTSLQAHAQHKPWQLASMFSR
jgi:hypothetical protein